MFEVLTASKPMKYNLMLETWNLLVYVTRLRKKIYIILWGTLAKIVEKIKLTKLKYLITVERVFILTTLHNENTPDGSLYLRLPYY